MSELTLGLDLGSQSLGWALIDEAGHKLIAAGVRVFPEGVDRDTSGAEIPKMQQRREARGMRRQIARRARRKRKLRALLVKCGLLPDVALLPNDHPHRVQWESDAFKAEDPYSLRARALRAKLTPHELGRTLLHLNQHRGFLSNRKADRAAKAEQQGLLAEISTLQADLNGRTLGEYLSAQRDPDPKRHHLVRLRGRHTHRTMYKEEFDAIVSKQREYHPDLLTTELADTLCDLMFFQRPLKPPSAGLVGRCELLPRLPRCPRADRRAQRLRLLLEVNNLRYLDTSTRKEDSLDADQRQKLIAFLAAKKERSFDDIRKHLFDQNENILFNLERGGRKKLLGMPTDAVMSAPKVLGKAWKGIPEDIKDRIVSAIIDDDETRLKDALKSANLDENQVEKLLEIPLEESYSSYSLHAIKRLLPHVERGLQLTSRDKDTPCAFRDAGFLLPWEAAVQRRPFLDEPPSVTNPLVRTALHEVRKVVNSILRELVYKPGHTLRHIHIEMAREVRGTAQQRSERSREMRDREKLRDAAAEQIRAHGVKVTRLAIEQFLLWQQQGEVCVYSGRPISIAQLLGGEVNLDHILPWSRSLDNSQMNKVVCFRNENDAKGDQTPFEWLAKRNPEKFELVLQAAKRLPYPKFRRFFQESLELDDFFARQFVDTAYITTQVSQYVQSLGADVLCPKGMHTADLRYHWGLNTVLRQDDEEIKNREDHRHHAVDAIVIALTNRSRLQKLAAINRSGGTQRTGEILPEPWSGFRNEVESMIGALMVSHRARHRVTGPLHEETVYGPTLSGPTEKEFQAGRFVYRKPVSALTLPMIDDIRDSTIRNLIIGRLAKFGLTPGEKGKIPAEVWEVPITMPSGIPIKKVRLLKSDLTIQPIRQGKAFVKPGGTHHLCVFESLTRRGTTQRKAVWTTRLEASRRLQAREPLYSRVHPSDPEAKFVMSLSPGDMLVASIKGKERILVFRTSASTQGQLYFVEHTDARPDKKIKKFAATANSLKARKVTIDPLGRIRWAND